jgi:hypothetical protein
MERPAPLDLGALLGIETAALHQMVCERDEISAGVPHEELALL